MQTHIQQKERHLPQFIRHKHVICISADSDFFQIACEIHTSITSTTKPGPHREEHQHETDKASNQSATAQCRAKRTPKPHLISSLRSRSARSSLLSCTPPPDGPGGGGGSSSSACLEAGPAAAAAPDRQAQQSQLVRTQSLGHVAQALQLECSHIYIIAQD